MKIIINDEAYTRKGFRISTDTGLLDRDVIFNFLLRQSYWSNGLTTEKLNKAIDHSLCFGVYKDNATIGFARIITDKANFAYLCDVFILPGYRRLGLSKWLLQTIKAHDDLQNLRRWLLATADAHNLYRQFGFTELSKPERWMEIFSPQQLINE